MVVAGFDDPDAPETQLGRSQLGGVIVGARGLAGRRGSGLLARIRAAGPARAASRR